MTPEQLKESRRILKDVKDSERVGEYPYAREVLKLGFYCISALPKALDEIERLKASWEGIFQECVEKDAKYETALGEIDRLKEQAKL